MTTTNRDNLTPGELAALRNRERERQRLCRQRRAAGEPAPQPRRRTLKRHERPTDGERACPDCNRAFRHGGNGPLGVWCCPTCLAAAQPTLKLWPSLLDHTDPDDLAWDYRQRRAATATLLAAARLTNELADELAALRHSEPTDNERADLANALRLLNVTDGLDALLKLRRRRDGQRGWQNDYRLGRTRGQQAKRDQYLLLS